ncbi:MAG: tRNA (adenosine(37)-N6)-threonylcarbamoyltransferase complex transferase subunit TsaD [Bacteroidales bacterium]|nr:tRNA (adenosine(37)-N6)-threonylcarbamoyltransferase complex transferase subunit TsaD [Bacteroidales bacterium]MDD2686934.1 tRNA (adenosine(37)-N6)-threonylcarbamoyltransferase complex transferase subunit TsaD [Bacteroidales bacterium]MDD3330101.1 tRNA (adenosine(37)-N6)-threonylcarbamoyltransferase complex transferase subunit TsaD [Bacteroidales bacterium]MDD3690888.1 tRNA (adenosine(37)-N6)-threonylcarbamoyltransferase complex transferase subunit TsaD [Bacteroidales bacterium]MDD4044688.1 
MNVYILGIESSCDDTSAAVLLNNQLLSNEIANQALHAKYGGVVPEWASRAHLQNMIPVVDTALQKANISISDISAIAFTAGPGLLGSLLVGHSFAKAAAYALGIPLIGVDHLQAHILSHFIKNEKNTYPKFPFLCLLVSGGHTQIMRVNHFFDMKIIGTTIDDAAGETFDKAAKILGFPYPGGPLIDTCAKEGNPHAFVFNQANIAAYDYSFSGLKTSFLYFLRDQLKNNPNFIQENKANLCASIQHAICNSLMRKLIKAADDLNIQEIAIAGGVSANSALQERLKSIALKKNWNIYIPPLQLSTDNAAMIGIVGYYKFLHKDFSSINVIPFTRNKF